MQMTGLSMHEPELPLNPKTEVSRLNFDKMSQSFLLSVKSSPSQRSFPIIDYMQSNTLSQIISNRSLYGGYSLSSFTGDEREGFVQYGFARHKAGMDNTILDEPLAILAALGWVNKNAHLSLSEYLLVLHDIEKHSNARMVPKLTPLSISERFSKRLSDEVFTFRSDGMIFLGTTKSSKAS
jgi:hypothetical protein